MNHHTVAAVSIAGSCLDVLGSLYLAYDLLGGERGPLRRLTRTVSYSILFGLGYGLGLGVFFGIVAGIAIGITLSFELARATRGQQPFSLAWEAVFAAIRAMGFGIGLYHLVGLRFAAIFAVLNTGGQIFAYWRGRRPGMDYSPVRHRPRITRRMIWADVERALGHMAAALIASAFAPSLAHPMLFALRVGLTTGLVTAIGQSMFPFVEYFADNLPQRALGAFGVALIFCGFLLQSLQYFLTLFDVPIS